MNGFAAFVGICRCDVNWVPKGLGWLSRGGPKFSYVKIMFSYSLPLEFTIKFWLKFSLDLALHLFDFEELRNWNVVKLSRIVVVAPFPSLFTD